jgi:hypothetical protein
MIFTLLATGCAGNGESKEAAAPPPAMLAVEVRDNAEIEKYDLNGDKKADVWKHFNLEGGKDIPNAQRKRVLALKEMDVNFDTKVDMKIHYNKFGAVVKEVMDLDFDGKFDAIDYYTNGNLYKRELAMNFAAKANMWKFFSKGRMIRKERDTNRTGKPDLFEYYEKGRLIRIGYDRDGDGKPDDYDEVGTTKK